MAIRLGFPPSAVQDIVQETLLNDMTKPQRKATDRQLVIDAVRKLFGRSLHGKAPSTYFHKELSIEDYNMVDQSVEDGLNMIYQIDFLKIYKITTSEERLILFLKEAGFTDRELGVVIGISESGVNKKIKMLLVRVSKYIKRAQVV